MWLVAEKGGGKNSGKWRKGVRAEAGSTRKRDQIRESMMMVGNTESATIKESNRTRFQKLISQYRDVQICSEKLKEIRLSQEEKAIKTTRDRTSHWQSTQAPVY